MYLQAFYDEFEKIAAAKWRTMLRAGNVVPEDISRLMTASRPGGGALLDRSREIAGLSRGNAALSKRTGFKIQEIGSQQAKADLKTGLKGLVTGKPGQMKEIVHQGIGAVLSPLGGGAVTVPATKRIYVQSNGGLAGIGLHSKAHKGLITGLKRHEIDEARAYRALEKKKGAKNIRQEDGFNVLRSPQSPQDEALADSLSGVREKFRAASNKIQSLKPAASPVTAGNFPRNVVEGVKGKLRSGADAVSRKLETFRSRLPEGMVPAGKHFSPNVVLNEGEYMPMMPRAAARELSQYRSGEYEAMGRFGYRPVRSVTKKQRKNIISAFNKKQLYPGQE